MGMGCMFKGVCVSVCVGSIFFIFSGGHGEHGSMGVMKGKDGGRRGCALFFFFFLSP